MTFLLTSVLSTPSLLYVLESYRPAAACPPCLFVQPSVLDRLKVARRVAVRTLVTDPRARLLLDGHITRRLAVALTPFAFVRSPILQLVVVCSLTHRSPYLQAITTRHSPDHCPPIRMAAVCQSKQSVLPSRQPQTQTHRKTGVLEPANQATMST